METIHGSSVTEVQPDGLNVTPSHSKLAFNSRKDVEYKDHQSYIGNLCKDVAIDELKGLGVDEKVDLGQSVIEVHELKVFDEMPRSNVGENEMSQLSENVPEIALRVFDQNFKRNLDEKDREECSDETIVDKYACCRKNLHKIEECETVPKVENENFNNTSLETMKFKLDARVSHVGLPYKNLHYKSMEACFTNEYEQMTKIDGVDTSENCSSMPIFGPISVEGQNFIVVGILSQESDLLKYHMKELEKDDIKEYIRNNYRSMLLSEIKEFHVTYEMVGKTFDVEWANELKKEGLRFIVINISPTTILLLKAYLEFDGKNSFLGEWSQLKRPPPEPPPRQLVLLHVVSVGKKLPKVKCIVWSKNKGLTQPSIYALQSKYPHSNPWSLRTRTILRGWICYDPFLMNYLIDNIYFSYVKVLEISITFL